MPEHGREPADGGQPEALSRNGLREALLGLLAVRPMSGYDLSRSYTRALQQIWYAPQGQVYPTLRRMHRDGLLRVSVEMQEGKPNRKVYSLTDRGREALVGWLSRPATLPRMHHEFIHKLFLLNHLDMRTRRAFVESYSERMRVWAGELRGVETRLEGALGGEYSDSAWQQLLALRHLIRIVDCEADSAIRISEEMAVGPRRGRGRHRLEADGDRSVLAGLHLTPTNGGGG